MKRYELIEMRRVNGGIGVTMYDRLNHAYRDHFFLYYPKKEVIWRLRNVHDCVVPREFC